LIFQGIAVLIFNIWFQSQDYSMIEATRPEPTVLPPSRCYSVFVYIANYNKMGIFFIYIIRNICLFFWLSKILEAF